jgi:hypothetical protein
MDDRGKLREVLAAGATETGRSMKALSVLSEARDPYRMDTPAKHRDGAWLAEQVERLQITGTIHLRGLHYQLIGSAVKPDGTPYVNTEEDWEWMSEKAAKYARWLGYIPFKQIVDHRNPEPTIRLAETDELHPFIGIGVEVEIPDAEDLEPRVGIAGFEGRQPYKLVFFGEKSSLFDEVGPLAERFDVDLYLITGEISDTLIYRMASEADDRPMVVFTFADADPSGWQMPVSIGRKLQALHDLEFPDLAYEVRPVSLTPEQVRTYGLPSTPMKAGESRADAWTEAMNTEQTEIDALLVLRPGQVEALAEEAVMEFYDADLPEQVRAARREWLTEAQAVFDEHVDEGEMDRLKADAEEKLDELRESIDEIARGMQMQISDDMVLPEPVVPESTLEAHPLEEALIDSAMSFAEQSERMIARKAYES